MQPVENEDDANVPDEQPEQTVDDASEYEPVEQAPVTAERPVLAQKEPAGHAVHAVAPTEAIKAPPRQLEHTVDEANEYFPAAQIPVTAVRPVVAQ